MAKEPFSLVWPKSLFIWEARRVLEMPDSAITKSVAHLLAEATDDADAAAGFEADIGEGIGWAAPSDARDWLEGLLSDDARLISLDQPVYYAERQGMPSGAVIEGGITGFAFEFVQLLWEMKELGYFPKALPRGCVDTDDYDPAKVTKSIRRAVKLEITWPVEALHAWTLDEAELFSLVEYFHDAARRPRLVERWHSFGDCGPHYGDHSRESGGVVYRWRVNDLLESYGVDLRLAATGPEKGRLVRHFSSGLDDLADAQVEARAADVQDEVAHAIRNYRERDASLPQRRSALALLAGALEPRRKAIGARVTLQDESDLFQIANKFAIRHRNSQQRDDYGPEFLDWIFWNYLAMIELMEGIDRRSSTP